MREQRVAHEVEHPPPLTLAGTNRGQHAGDEETTRVGPRALGSAAPDHGAPQALLRRVVGGLHPGGFEEAEHAVPLPEEVRAQGPPLPERTSTSVAGAPVRSRTRTPFGSCSDSEWSPPSPSRLRPSSAWTRPRPSLGSTSGRSNARSEQRLPTTGPGGIRAGGEESAPATTGRARMRSSTGGAREARPRRPLRSYPPDRDAGRRGPLRSPLTISPWTGARCGARSDAASRARSCSHGRAARPSRWGEARPRRPSSA